MIHKWFETPFENRMLFFQKQIFSIVLLCLTSCNVLAQQNDSIKSLNSIFLVKISGKVKNVGDYCPDIPKIIVFENKDTLLITSCDPDGDYFIETNFSQGNEYSILLDVPYNKPIQLLTKTDTLFVPITYELDFPKSLYRKEYFYPGFFFEFNSMEMITHGLDLVGIRCTLQNNPGLCLEMGYMINPDENKKIVAKRLVKFKENMKNAGVDMKRIQFVEYQLQKSNKPEIDMRSRFEAAVYSLEGNCFQ